MPLAAKKEAYRLWFEYLKVARRSRRPDVVAALARSERFYASWHMDSADQFNAWWAEHKPLFVDYSAARILTPNEAPSDPNALVIEVPLTKSLSRLTTEVEALIRHALAQRPSDSEMRRVDGEYPLTEESEPNLVVVRESLSVYRDVYLKSPNLRGEKLLLKAHEYYLTRKNKKWAKIPTPLLYDANDTASKARALRNLRRYITKAERIELSVAQGEFPGRLYR